MKKRLTLLRFGAAVLSMVLEQAGIYAVWRWLFPELGPAVIQDSGLGRSPALESPFGIIGDIPGCYSLYDGNPLQHVDVGSPKQSSDMEIVILAIVFAIIPLTGVLILGRRSYGATKTQ